MRHKLGDCQPRNHHHKHSDDPRHYDGQIRRLADQNLALRILNVVGVALLAVVAVPKSEALEAVGRAQGAGNAAVVVVAHHRLAAVVVRV
jgi:hypothetical protein